MATRRKAKASRTRKAKTPEAPAPTSPAKRPERTIGDVAFEAKRRLFDAGLTAEEFEALLVAWPDALDRFAEARSDVLRAHVDRAMEVWSPSFTRDAVFEVVRIAGESPVMIEKRLRDRDVAWAFVHGGRTLVVEDPDEREIGWEFGGARPRLGALDASSVAVTRFFEERAAGIGEPLEATRQPDGRWHASDSSSGGSVFSDNTTVIRLAIGLARGRIELRWSSQTDVYW